MASYFTVASFCSIECGIFLLQNEQFPSGLGIGGESIYSVLLQPVLQSSGDVVGKPIKMSTSLTSTEEMNVYEHVMVIY